MLNRGYQNSYPCWRWGVWGGGAEFRLGEGWERRKLPNNLDPRKVCASRFYGIEAIGENRHLLKKDIVGCSMFANRDDSEKRRNAHLQCAVCLLVGNAIESPGSLVGTGI